MLYEPGFVTRRRGYLVIPRAEVDFPIKPMLYFPIELLNSYVQRDRRLKAMDLTPYVAKRCI